MFSLAPNLNQSKVLPKPLTNNYDRFDTLIDIHSIKLIQNCILLYAIAHRTVHDCIHVQVDLLQQHVFIPRMLEHA